MKTFLKIKESLFSLFPNYNNTEQQKSNEIFEVIKFYFNEIFQIFSWLYKVGSQFQPDLSDIEQFESKSLQFLESLKGIGFGQKEFKDYEHILIKHATQNIKV